MLNVLYRKDRGRIYKKNVVGAETVGENIAIAIELKINTQFLILLYNNNYEYIYSIGIINS